MSQETESGFPVEELRKFSESGRVIAAAMDTSVELWARAEAAVILKAWAGKTKVGAESKLERRGLIEAYRRARRAVGFSVYKGGVEPGQGSINLGIRGTFGRVWYRTRKNGKFQGTHAAGFRTPVWRIKNDDWLPLARLVDDFRSSYRRIVEQFKASAGLSRQSIVQIADDLGIRLEDVKGGGTLSAVGIAKARAALASNGQTYRNGIGIVGKTAREFYVTLVNRYPKAGPLFMDKTLMQVISGRIGYFKRNLEEGAFLSLEQAAKKYPYLAVLKTAA